MLYIQNLNILIEVIKKELKRIIGEDINEDNIYKLVVKFII